jgi:hypothetical protein
MELLEKLAALVPLPRVHLVRYGGCLAPHSHLRGAIIPTLRQQGVDENFRIICPLSELFVMRRRPDHFNHTGLLRDAFTMM